MVAGRPVQVFGRFVVMLQSGQGCIWCQTVSDFGRLYQRAVTLTITGIRFRRLDPRMRRTVEYEWRKGRVGLHKYVCTLIADYYPLVSILGTSGVPSFHTF